MTAGSTHDTKRGEDVRARISVLAEVPDVWAAALDRLLELVPVPDPGFGNLLWQAVLGAWPASRERLHAYAEKAMREAGDRTQWTAPDEAYEAAVHAAVDAAFDDAEVRTVLDELVEPVAGPGLEQRPCREAGHADGPRRARRLPGQRAVGAEPRRPRQPPAGRLRPAGCAAQAAAGRRAAAADPGPGRRGRGQAAAHPRRAQRPARAPRALRRLRAGARRPGRPPTTCWPSTAAVRSASPPGCRSASPPAAAGATPSLPLPSGLWIDLLTGRRFRAAEAGGLRLAELLERLPGRAAGPRRPARP